MAARSKQQFDLPSTDKKGFYKQLIELLFPFLQLSKVQSDILALLIYYYFEIPGTEEEKYSKLWSYDTRMLIRAEVDCTESTFNNSMFHIRKSGAVRYDKLSPVILVDIDKDFALTFNFHVEDTNR